MIMFYLNLVGYKVRIIDATLYEKVKFYLNLVGYKAQKSNRSR